MGMRHELPELRGAKLLATLYQAIYNGHRSNMALIGLTPQQCLQRLLIAE